MSAELSLKSLSGVPIVEAGDDLSGIILAAILSRPEAPPLLEVNPQSVDLGIVAQGKPRIFRVWLNNLSPYPVTIAQFQSSCPCLQFKDSASLPLAVQPHQQSVAEFHLDLRQQPQFCGDLLLDLRGITVSGEIAFATQVSLRVLPTRRSA